MPVLFSPSVSMTACKTRPVSMRKYPTWSQSEFPSLGTLWQKSCAERLTSLICHNRALRGVNISWLSSSSLTAQGTPPNKTGSSWTYAFLGLTLCCFTPYVRSWPGICYIERAYRAFYCGILQFEVTSGLGPTWPVWCVVITWLKAQLSTTGDQWFRPGSRAHNSKLFPQDDCFLMI